MMSRPGMEIQPLRFLDGEHSEQFHQGMADRMTMSFAKYGHVTDESVKKYDPIANLKIRLEKYELTGNTEWLMDVGNCAMIEFMFPQHPNAHYRPTTTEESPGRSRRIGDGHVLTHAANTAAEDNRRLGGSSMTTTGGHYRREGD